MSWWFWVALCWIVVGVALVFVIERAARTSGTDGPLSQGSVLGSIAFSMALVAGAPLVLGFVLVQSCLMLWQGSIPLTNRHWWPSRARRFGARLPEDSRESTLCRMLELRRRHDGRLAGQPKPSDWPMFALWQTPEAMILQVVELFAILESEGMPADQALERIDAQRRAKVSASARAAELRSYIAECLRIDDPEFLRFGDSLLDRAITTATRFAQAEAVRLLSKRFPPREWLIRAARPAELAKLAGGTGSRLSYEWNRMSVRRGPSDEFWEFASPAESWQRMCGRGGIALVRDGECIDHVITVMN